MGNKNRKNKGKKNKTIRTKNQKKNVTSSACLASVIDALKKRVIVFNFENQRKRVERQTKLAGLKFGKRTIFAGIAAKLIKAGGGNNQSLSCKGSTTSQEAKNLTSLSQTLLKCDAEITKVCGPSFPKYDMDLVQKCEPKSKEFITLAKDCLKKDVVSDEANTCKCWTDPKFMEIVKGVATCEIKEKNEIADAIDKCKKTFMLCKKSEDATVNLIYKCQACSSGSSNASSTGKPSTKTTPKSTGKTTPKSTGKTTPSKCPCPTCPSMTTASTLSPTCCTCPCTKCTTQSKIDRCYADINKQASIILKAKKQEKEIETAINNLDKLKALISAAATGRVMRDITDDKYTKIMQLSNDTATVTKIGSICNLDQVKKLQQKTSSLVDEAIKAVDKFSDAKTKMIEAVLKEIDKYEDQIFTILGIPSSATTAKPKPTTSKPKPTI